MNKILHRGREHVARARLAYKIMQEVYDRCQAEGQTPGQTSLAIRDAYPWGERRAWPYKAWLQARREFFEKHGLPIKERTSLADAVQESDS